MEANLQQLDTVNMSAQAALKSQDIAQVKKGRATIKSQLTTAVKRVEVLFSKKAGDDFDHRSISKTELKNIKAKMNENFDLFQKLHDKCCELREPGADETEEEENARQDEEYSEEVTSKVYPLMDQFKDYDRSLKKVEAKQTLIQSIPEKEKKLEEALEAFKVSKDNALQIVKCLENLSPDDIFESSLVQLQPADSAKESLSKEFANLTTSASELKSAMEARGDEATVIGQKLKFNRTEELKKVGMINIDLDKILEAKKINSEKNKSGFSNPVHSSTFREPTTSSTALVSPIKLNKPDPIKFSGQPRDFATFRRDFEAIIVPNRSAADIGLYLK